MYRGILIILMYKEFYGLKENPFNVTSDPSFLFYSRTHKEALEHLLYGIRQKKGFVTITGEIGAGKTTLCKAIINQMDETTKTAFILNPSLSGIQLLEAILEEFGIKPEKRNKISLFKQLNSFLIDELYKNHNVVLLIDEAQNIKNSLLEEIRMLSNLETEKEKLFQIILVGQPQLLHKLNSPDLVQLKQRVAVRFHITPLDRAETGNYIYHRLNVAGSNNSISFTEKALNSIYLYSRGIPRIINLACDRALLHAYVKELHLIDETIVTQSLIEIDANVEKIGIR